MGEIVKEPFPPEKPPSSGRSIVVGLLVGCATLLVIAGVLACGGLLFLGWKGYGQLDKFAGPFQARGYERVQGQVIEVSQPVSKPTVYVAQVVKLNADADADLAVMAQVAEIAATVHGDIDFLGQTLVVKPNGVVHGDIRVQGAQVIDVKGTVDGEIAGSYQILRQPPGKSEAVPDSIPRE